MAASTGRYFHEAVFYHGVDDLIERSVQFVRRGLEGDEAVLVVLTADKLERLRRALGPDSRRVRFADMMAVGRNPSTIIPAWRDFLDAHPGRPARGIGEPIFAARRPDELVEAQRHEALLNLAFESVTADFELLCPYDLATLGSDVLESARLNHPHLGHDEERQRCRQYPGDEAARTAFTGRLPAAPAHAGEVRFDASTLDSVRGLVAGIAGAAELPPDRVSDLLLAASEVAANSVRHGGGRGLARAWRTDESVFFEVEDSGSIPDALAGRRRPAPSAEGGRGLWLVNHLCDLVEVRSTADRTCVRIQLRS